jgi:hypothetical protein
MSWKVSKDVCNIFAGQNRSTLTCAEHREAGNRIGNGPELKRMLLKRGQNDAAALDIGIERIAGPDAKPAPYRAGKNDLPLGGNLGLHGKTISPS